MAGASRVDNPRDRPCRGWLLLLRRVVGSLAVCRLRVVGLGVFLQLDDVLIQLDLGVDSQLAEGFGHLLTSHGGFQLRLGVFE